MAFQRSNWTRTALAEKARVYANSAIATGNVTGNGGVQTVTVTVPFQFQGNGQVQASLPAGSVFQNSALDLAAVSLIAPSGVSYAAGSHPRVQFQVQNSSNSNSNIQTALDVIIVQY
jgi:hypothetical protein